MQRLLGSAEADGWATPLLVAGGLLPALSPQVRAELLLLAGKDIPEPSGQTMTGVALVLGLFSGLMQALLWPLLLHGASRVLGVRGAPKRVARLAAGWSSVPVLLGYLLAPLFGSAQDGQDFFSFLTLLLSCWSLVLLAFMLAAGYGFPVGRGFMAVGLGVFFGLTLLMALATLLTLLTVGLHPA